MANFDDLLDNTAPQQGGQLLSKEDYAAKKQAERETVYELSDNTAIEVAGDGGRFRQYLDVQTQFDRYSAVNALLILAQFKSSKAAGLAEATRLGDFDYWKNQGAYVGKGQTGISILEPGKEYERDDGSIGVSYNVKKVFDVSQVDARKIKTQPAPQFTERQILSALISKAPMKISGVDELPNGDGARTDPDTGEISVLKGMAFPDTFRAVAHELTLAEVNRESNTDPQFTAYCASYMLCRKYGVDTQQYDFGSAPVQFADMEPQEVKHELSVIREAAETVHGRMSRQLDAIAKTADLDRSKAVKSRDEAR
jgi:hypothetical protein